MCGDQTINPRTIPLVLASSRRSTSNSFQDRSPISTIPYSEKKTATYPA